MLKDITGVSGEDVEVSEPASLNTVWDLYSARFPRLAELKPHLRLALNHEFAKLDAALSAGDEIALLPPVSGGSATDLPLLALVREPIETRSLAQAVQQTCDGAVVTFEGVVRDNTKGRRTKFLDYECYEPMALRLIEELAADLSRKYAIGRIAIVHRLGPLAIGEASVVIAVSAPHRKPAFEACFEAINRLKASVPIWKKEHFADGEVWVEGEWEDHATVPRA